MPPQNTSGEAPKDRMTPMNMVTLLFIGIVFDFLKMLFALLIFFLPIIIGAGAGVVAAQNADDVGCFIGKALGWSLGGPIGMIFGCATGSAVGEANAGKVGVVVGGAATAASGAIEALTPIGAGVAFFGSMMAMAIAFFGWILVIVLLILMRVEIFSSARNLAMLIAGFTTSEVPIVDAIPTFTPTLIGVILATRKEDAEAKAAYAEAQAREQAQLQLQRQRAYAMYLARMQQAVNDNEIPAATPLAA